MHIYCHFITIALLFTFFSNFTRQTRATKTFIPITPKTAVILPSKEEPHQNNITTASIKTFKQLHDDIAAMPSNKVIAPDGIFTDYFIEFVQDNVKKSELSSKFASALFEVGMNLHAPLSDNDSFNTRMLQRAAQQIQTIVADAKPSLLTQAPSSAEATIAEPVEDNSNRYTDATNMELKDEEKNISTIQKQQPKQSTPLKPKNPGVQPIESPAKKPAMQPDAPKMVQPIELPEKKVITEPDTRMTSRPIESLINSRNSYTDPKNDAKNGVPMKRSVVGLKNSLNMGSPVGTQRRLGLKSWQKLSGPEGLKEFRRDSLTQPMESFYADAKMNQDWLKKALSIVLADAKLTTKNKAQIQHELISNATELMREFLHKNDIKSNLWNIFLENATQQVVSFMNNQLLHDQKQQPLLPKSKSAHVEPLAVQSKVPASEPKQKSIQKPERDPALPLWISADYTLIIKEFEIEMLKYIFKNHNADEKTIFTHFAQKLPKNIKNKEIILNAIKLIIKNTFQEPVHPLPALEQPKKMPIQENASKKELPNWIDSEGFTILQAALIHEIMNYFAQNTDADNDAIFNHFRAQLPSEMPSKKLIEAQLKAIIKTLFTP